MLRNPLFKHLFFTLAFFAGHVALAQSPWLAIVGDVSDPAADTVQVDPVTFNRAGALRTVRVRVSRSLERKSWDGAVYRSYVSDVLIDCVAGTGRYVSIEFFDQPVWEGEPHGKAAYSRREIRPMLFRDMDPNPTARLIRAACQTENVKSK
jgi:hypothetical protein